MSTFIAIATQQRQDRRRRKGLPVTSEGVTYKAHAAPNAPPTSRQWTQMWKARWHGILSASDDDWRPTTAIV